MHDEEALSRIREMRSVFRKYQDHIGGFVGGAEEVEMRGLGASSCVQ